MQSQEFKMTSQLLFPDKFSLYNYNWIEVVSDFSNKHKTYYIKRMDLNRRTVVKGELSCHPANTGILRYLFIGC